MNTHMAHSNLIEAYSLVRIQRWLLAAVSLFIFAAVIGQAVLSQEFLYSYSDDEYLNLLAARGFFTDFLSGSINANFFPLQNVNAISCGFIGLYDRWNEISSIPTHIMLAFTQAVLGIVFLIRFASLISNCRGRLLSIWAVLLVLFHPLFWQILFQSPSVMLQWICLTEILYGLNDGIRLKHNFFYFNFLLSWTGSIGLLLAVLFTMIPISMTLFTQWNQTSNHPGGSKPVWCAITPVAPALFIYLLLSAQWGVWGGPILSQYSTIFNELTMHKLWTGYWSAHSFHIVSMIANGLVDPVIPTYLVGFLSIVGLQVLIQFSSEPAQRVLGIALSITFAMLIVVTSFYSTTLIEPLVLLLPWIYLTACLGIEWAIRVYANGSLKWYCATAAALACYLILSWPPALETITNRIRYNYEICASIQRLLDQDARLLEQKTAIRFHPRVFSFLPTGSSVFPIGLKIETHTQNETGTQRGFHYDLRYSRAPYGIIWYSTYEEQTSQDNDRQSPQLPERWGKIVTPYYRQIDYRNLSVYTRSEETTELAVRWLHELYQDGEAVPFHFIEPPEEVRYDSSELNLHRVSDRTAKKNSGKRPTDPIGDFTKAQFDSETVSTRVGLAWNFENQDTNTEQIGKAFGAVLPTRQGEIGLRSIGSEIGKYHRSLGYLRSDPFYIEGDDLTLLANLPSDSTQTLFCLAVYQTTPRKTGTGMLKAEHILNRRQDVNLMEDTFYYIKPEDLSYTPDTLEGWRVVRFHDHNTNPGWQRIEWSIHPWKNKPALWMAVDAGRDGSIAIDQITQWKRPEGHYYDFEDGTYAGWSITGEAFGEHPATGPLGKQQPVFGYEGNYFINSYREGSDRFTGSMTTDRFLLKGDRMTFKIGGGDDVTLIYLALLIDGQIVLRATGQRSERLRTIRWDVSPWIGKQAQIQIADLSTDAWGHILVDDIRVKSTPRLLTSSTP